MRTAFMIAPLPHVSRGEDETLQPNAKPSIMLRGRHSRRRAPPPVILSKAKDLCISLLLQSLRMDTAKNKDRTRFVGTGFGPASYSSKFLNYLGVKSMASTIRLKGILAVSFSSLTTSGLEASKKHMQCASPGTNALRM